VLAGALASACARVGALDLAPLWNFSDPAASEQRFRAALATASGDDALILQTQIARTYGLRGDFETARRILHEIEPRLATAGAEARVRHALEIGRTYASAAHSPEMEIEGQSVQVGASIGIAFAAEADLDPESILRRADTALYAAKAGGRNCVRAHGDAPG